MGYNIAIDGPAGAGKSTIAKMVAKELGYIYVDTGAMYRAIALHLLRNQVREGDKYQMAKICSEAVITIGYERGVQQVYLQGEDVTDLLRDEAVGNLASVSSALPEVRKHLLQLQLELANTQDVVMDGRDIGTNILPNADVKIYLTASVETRAKRRCLELKEKGITRNFEQVMHDIEERDTRDMNRQIAPLKQAKDAVLLDSSEMTIEEVVAAILEVCTWR
ncbi:(d)CMP kinase [Lachnospiraceae bacterium LCP25S3_G4]